MMMKDDDGFLSEELVETILTFVPPTDLLQLTCYVSTRFAHIIRKESFWQEASILQQSTSSSSSTSGLSKHQIQRCCLLQQFVRDKKDIFPAYLHYGPVLASRTTAMQARRRQHDGVARCVVASTTDHASEQIENVLIDDEPHHHHEDDFLDDNDPDPRIRALLPLHRWMIRVRRTRWWSSSPSPNGTDSNDTLLFASRYPLMVLSKLKIKPLRDPYLLQEQNSIFYTSKRIIIKAYNIPMNKFVANNNINNGAEENYVDTNSTIRNNKGFPLLIPIVVPNDGAIADGRDAAAAARDFDQDQDDDEDDTDEEDDEHHAHHRHRPPVSIIPGQETIDQLLDGQNPVYESDEVVVPPDGNDMIEFDLTKTVNNPLVIANVVTFELLGKHHEQRPGMGYFCCVERVESEGIPLFQDMEQQAATTTTTATH